MKNTSEKFNSSLDFPEKENPTDLNETVEDFSQRTNEILSPEEEEVLNQNLGTEPVSPRRVYEDLLSRRSEYSTASDFLQAFEKGLRDGGVADFEIPSILERKQEEIKSFYPAEKSEKTPFSQVLSECEKSRDQFKNKDEFEDFLIRSLEEKGYQKEEISHFLEDQDLQIQLEVWYTPETTFPDPSLKESLADKKEALTQAQEKIKDYTLPEIAEKKNMSFEEFEAHLPDLQDWGLEGKIAHELKDIWQDKKKELYQEWKKVRQEYLDEKKSKKKEKKKSPWTTQFRIWTSKTYHQIKTYLIQMWKRWFSRSSTSTTRISI